MTIQKDSAGNEVRKLQEYVELGGRRVLEIGIGDGRLTWRFAKLAQHVTGIDLDRAELRIASIERGSGLQDKVDLAVANAIHLPFRNEAFDLALLSWTF